MRALGILVLLLGSAGGSFCQSAETDAYRTFFSQIQTLVNQQRRIQDALPGMDAEAAALSEISTRFYSEFRRLVAVRGAVHNEAIFRSIEDDAGKAAAWEKQQLSLIDKAETRLTAESLEALKATLGQRFQVLDGYVRSGTLNLYIAKAFAAEHAGRPQKKQ